MTRFVPARPVADPALPRCYVDDDDHVRWNPAGPAL
eukprot:gene3675-204_t